MRSDYKEVDKLFADYAHQTSWWGLFTHLLRGDITKLSAILKTELEQVLSWLQLKSAKAELDNKVQRVTQDEIEKKLK